ncbi:MAG: adenylosuccinate synthase [Calditrichaeota bacterium]|nr:MAG: adenylosuccinate synthase [Calditrichota bacterium]
MPVNLVVGAQWGDEGKAKVIDYLSKDVDFVARFQGGANAGHTVIFDGKKFILHLIPSGILYPHTTCLIGNGLVFDVEKFFAEIDNLESQGISTEGRLFVSPDTHLVLPYHKTQDALEEEKYKIGTTKRGIGPAYTDKISRKGIRVRDLLDGESFVTKVKMNAETKLKTFKALYRENFDEDLTAFIDDYLKLADRLRPYVKNITYFLNDQIAQDKNVLIEGAQGALLDIDFGTYPFVTSSNCTAGGAATGLGIPPSKLTKVTGVFKAYLTRVGSGPFPSEMEEEQAETVRKAGGEFGSTTGRPRRCGWFDAVAGRFSVMINGITDVALIKLDVLDQLDKIKICVAYEFEGKKIKRFESDLKILEKCKPIYEEFDGWKSDTSEVRSFDALPKNAQKFINRISELLEAKISIISISPDRKATFDV